MERNRRRDRQRRRDRPKPKLTVASSSSSSPTTEPPEGVATPTVHDVPDHVLELILLRLDDSVCLVRAASACRRWWRVVADPGLLDCFRLLRVPLILGHYASQRTTGDPIFVPSPTRSIHSRQSFNFDFVPRIDGTWKIADSRDTLLLLLKANGTVRSRRFNPELVVCEPLTRRYEALSCPPGMLSGGPSYLGVFLVDGRPGGGHGRSSSIGLSNFKVIGVRLREHATARGRGVPGVCVYSRREGSWYSASCVCDGDIQITDWVESLSFAGRANGSLYWGIRGAHAALAVDEATARASQVALPEAGSNQLQPRYDGRCFRVMGGEDGALRVVRLIEKDLRVFARFHGGGGEWVLERLLELPGDPYGLLGVHQTYVLVRPRHSTKVFPLDVKTIAWGRVQDLNMCCDGEAYTYELPWPPILKACGDSPR